MAKTEHLASAHEGLVHLLESLPRASLIEALCAATGLSLELVAYVRVRTPSVEVPGLTRPARRGAADFVLSVHGHSGKVIGFWAIEVQLSRDWTRRWAWALIHAAFAADLRVEGNIIAFCPTRSVREWVRDSIKPALKEQLVVFEADRLPLIHEVALVGGHPLEIILGAILHADTDDPEDLRVAGIRAAFLALQTLDEDACRRYTVSLMSLAPAKLVERALQELRAEGLLDESRFEQFSESELQGYSYNHGREVGIAEGRAEGIAEGRAEGIAEGIAEGRAATLRESIIDMLELRGLAVPEATRVRIANCAELAQLEAWYAEARAGTLELPGE